jgi:predicted transposase YdaD
MHLRVDLEERFKQELDELEESLQMPYVTSVERIAKTEGRTEGRTEGGALVLLKQMAKRWGMLPEDLQQQIRRLSLEQQAALGEAVLDFDTVKDVESWLAAYTHTN